MVGEKDNFTDSIVIQPVEIVDYTVSDIGDFIKSELVYHNLTFKVAGVTFKNGRKTRQAILRAFKWGDEDIESIDCEVYEYEDKSAVYVKFNNQIIGNIPSDLVATYLEYKERYKAEGASYNIYGGNKLDDGSRTSYGCEITLKFKELT